MSARLLAGALTLAALVGSTRPAGAQAIQPASAGSGGGAPCADLNPTFPELIKGSVTGFRKLPTRDSLMWLWIGEAASLAGHFGDEAVLRRLSGSDGLGDFLDSGRIIGGAPVQVGGALATYAIGRTTSSPRVTLVGADLVRAQALAQGMTIAAKVTVRRTRPDEGRFSFPSGHAATTFATATVLHRDLGWKAGIPAYAVASYVAASRIQMKRHYLSDVTFGAAVGIVAGRATTVGRGNLRFAVTPLPADGGGGVAFVWLSNP